MARDLEELSRHRDWKVIDGEDDPEMFTTQGTPALSFGQENAGVTLRHRDPMLSKQSFMTTRCATLIHLRLMSGMVGAEKKPPVQNQGFEPEERHG